MEIISRKTKCGEILGRKTDKGIIFNSIPYASAGRFEMPKPINSWDGGLDATGTAIEAMQMSAFRDDSHKFYTKEFRTGLDVEYAESPLTLSIITPLEPDNCPILVHIHGGSFFVGRSVEKPAGSSFEYARRGIILVNISYRLNVFGLYRSANYFLYDQIAAVKWIRDNIGDYGGNGDDITLIGESAGAMSIFYNLCNEELKGIIKGAVLMSGAGFFPRIADGYTVEGGKKFWDAVMHAAECENDEQLKKVPAEKLWNAWNETSKKFGGLKTMQPGIDGRLIPCSPHKIRKNGKLLDIPMIVGVTSQDMLFSALMYGITLNFCGWSAKRGRSKVYAYYFNHPVPGGDYKAFHSGDLWYVFGNMEKSGRPFNEDDIRLKDEMADAVEKFIKTGDAGWEPVSRKNHKFRRFDLSGKKYIGPVKCFALSLHYSIFDRGPF